MTTTRSKLWSRFAAAFFSEAAARTGLSDVDLAAALRSELGRDALSRQTIGAWKRGEQLPPMPASWATLKLAGVTLAECLAPVLLRNPEFIELMVIPADEAAVQRLATALRALELMTTPARTNVLDGSK